MRSATFAAFLLSAALPTIATALTDADSNKFDSTFARRTVGGATGSDAGHDLEARDEASGESADVYPDLHLQARDTAVAADADYLQKRWFWAAIPAVVSLLGAAGSNKPKVKREDAAVFLNNFAMAKRDGGAAPTDADVANFLDALSRNNAASPRIATRDMDPATIAQIDNYVATHYKSNADVIARDLGAHMDQHAKRALPLTMGLLGVGSALLGLFKRDGEPNLDVMHALSRRDGKTTANGNAADPADMNIAIFSDDGKLVDIVPESAIVARSDGGITPPANLDASHVMAVFDKRGNLLQAMPPTQPSKRLASDEPIMAGFDLGNNLVTVSPDGRVQKRDNADGMDTAPVDAAGNTMALFDDNGNMLGYLPAQATKRDLPAGAQPNAMGLFDNEGKLVGLYPRNEAPQERDLGEDGYADEADIDEADSDEAFSEDADADEAYADEAFAEDADVDEADADEADFEDALQKRDEDAGFDEADAEEANADEAEADEADADEAEADDAFAEEAYLDEADADEAFAEEADSEDAIAKRDEADFDAAFAEDADFDEADFDQAFAEEADADEADADEADADEADADEADADEADSDEADSDEADALEEQLVRRVIGMRGAPIGWGSRA